MRIHPLEAYLANQVPPIGKVSFAARIGVSASALSRVFCGKRRHLDADACLRIVDATAGAVTLEQLLTWKPSAALAKPDGRLKPRRTAPRKKRAA